MNNLTDVVKKLLILNVGAFFLVSAAFQQYMPMLAMHSPLESDYFAPYQLVTHMFMHADIGHLMFNMLSLYFLGPYVERTLGPKRFLILYLVAGFVAMAAHFFLSNNPVVGASGAIYGVIFAFIAMFPDVKLMLLIPPIPVKARYLALGLVVYDLFMGIQGTSGTAHFAHLGGALAGVLLIVSWRMSNFRM